MVVQLFRSGYENSLFLHMDSTSSSSELQQIVTKQVFSASLIQNFQRYFLTDNIIHIFTAPHAKPIQWLCDVSIVSLLIYGQIVMYDLDMNVLRKWGQIELVTNVQRRINLVVFIFAVIFIKNVENAF